MGGTKISEQRRDTLLLMGWGVIPTPRPGKTPPCLPPPPGKPRKPEAQRARPRLQGHESAGSCPGLTPNHGGRATSVRGEKLPWAWGWMEASGKACGAGAPCFCQWPSQPSPSPSFRATAAKYPPSAQGPAPPCTQGPCPTRGSMGLSLAPAICMASPPPQQLSQRSPLPRARL